VGDGKEKNGPYSRMRLLLSLFSDFSWAMARNLKKGKIYKSSRSVVGRWIASVYLSRNQ
jgi:hypothetical protein